MLAQNHSSLQAAAMVLQAADGLLITAGAGMGVDSGLPDFRGSSGFWKTYPALGDSGLQFQDIANPQAFARDPHQAWGFYGHRLQLYRDTQPHEGFAILKRWASHKTHGCYVFTSNVDGHFQSAGFASQQVYECHGSIHQLQCCTPCQHATWSADELSPLIDATACRWLSDLPQCLNCQQLSRPNILMFDDWNWVDTARAVNDAALEAFVGSCRQMAVIEIGAGTEVSTVRHFSERMAQTYQAPLIRINPREHHCDLSNSIGIAMGAQAALLALDELLPI